MSLDLDKRQRAMLREMGVRVWQPAAPVAMTAPMAPMAEAETATDLIAVGAHDVAASGSFDQNNLATGVVAAPASAGPPARPPEAGTASVAAAPARVAPAGAVLAAGPLAWRLGEARALYAGAAHAGGARWLVLAEAGRASADPASDPFQGDAGKLLDNMLRAARLHRAGVALLAPLMREGREGRQADAGPELGDFQQSLAALIAGVQPDVVLVMGRLAAQALLPSGEPLGKLRGQAHRLHGVRAVVTYDAPYLLRSPLDKAKAWDDLCLAISLLPPADAAAGI